MPDAAPFLAAIRAAPADDAPRLVYADWLDERGQPERAEFIRVQCELARRESADLRAREDELLRQHHDAFAGPLAGPWIRYRFERGFIAAFSHKGLFWGEEGQGRRRMTTFLRFLLDGTVGGTTTTLRSDEMFVWLGRHGTSSIFAGNSGRYALDPLRMPAGLRFVLSSEGSSSTFQGAFVGSSLDLEVQIAATRQFRQRFTLVPDAIPETVMDP
ncbi:MAG TPA: TIGR02996 domain-containing protein [Gemmataceae bacterium]|nr:TIGR02996 domain-containing protein [Gemmataceae bacterium]